MQTGPKVETPPQPMPVWMTAYLAGPMRGYEFDNFPAFDAAAEQLRLTGIAVFSPAEHDRELGYAPWDPETFGCITLKECMQWDLQQVAACDATILLPGWEKSEGANRELTVALWCGRDVYLYNYDSLRRRPVLTPCPEFGTHETPRQFIESHEGAIVGYALPLDDIKFTGEHRVTSETGGEKGSKLARFDLLPPDALKAVAEHYGRNTAEFGGKYADRNWESAYPWHLSFASLQRHAQAWWGGEELDEEGQPHVSAMAWHALALLTFSLRGIGEDDRHVI